MSDDPRAANLTGAVALGLATDLTAAIETATGATATEVAALTTLANWADGLSIDRLREVTALSQPGCARLVDRLVGSGYARRERFAGEDRRVTAVHITARGRRLVAAARTARADAVDRWLDRLAPSQRRVWGELVEVLAGTDIASAVDANRRCRLCDAPTCGQPDGCPVTRAIPPSTS